VLQSILLSGGFDETCSIHFETLAVVKYSDTVPRCHVLLILCRNCKKSPPSVCSRFFRRNNAYCILRILGCCVKWDGDREKLTAVFNVAPRGENPVVIVIKLTLFFVIVFLCRSC